MARNEAAFGRKLTSDPGQVCAKCPERLAPERMVVEVETARYPGQYDPRPEIYISDDVPAKGIA
jgi:hypothetical protein